MVVASNGVIDKPGVFETRRGFTQFGSVLAGVIYKLFAFQKRLLANHGSLLAYDSTGAGAWVDYAGTFVAIAGDKIRGTEVNSNFYFTTNNGVYKIDTITNNPYLAGGVAALDTTVAASGSTGFLANNGQAAYRITWVYTDSNGNEIEGDPSMSVTLSNNTGNPTNGALTFTIPSVVTTNYYYRVYRTLQTASLSIAPSDTFQLAYQAQPASADITNKYISITDVTPDALLGQLLYTSPGAEGEFQTNDPPPLAHDICTFLGMTFYANCSTIQQFYITLISAGAPSGIQVGDTVSLVGTSTHTYTGHASNVYASQEFQIVTGGTVAANIDATARNLVGAINQDPTNTEFYAYYVTGFNQLPGQILIQARNISHAAFTAISSRGGAFSPIIPVSGATYVSSNNVVLNGIYVSKLNQPEAVPVVNLIFVGSADQPIYRVYPLRNSVIAESQGGVFRITGTSPDTLTVTPFDNTVIQYGNDTGVTLNNSVYSFSTQGVISVTESGSQIMSRDVEGDLLALSSLQAYPNFPSISFGVSYESDRKYILAMAQNTTDTVSTVQYVYNWITQGFTTWNLSVTHGIVNPNDNLLYWAASDGQVLQERKTYTMTDFVDRQWAVTISSVSGFNVVLNDVSNATVGTYLAQGVGNGQVNLSSQITAVNTMTNTVTVEDLLFWSGGSASIYQPINCAVTYAPLTCGYPAFIKRFQPVMDFVFGASSFESATITFSTDFYPIGETVTITPKLTGGWGTFPWGTLPWGVSSAPLQIIPTYLTKNTMSGHWLNIGVSINQAFQNISLSGITGFFDLQSERFR